MAFRISLPKNRLPLGCLIAAIAMLLVCVVLFALFYIKLNGPFSRFPKALKATIQITLDQPGGGKFDLNQVTQFAWDKAFFFEPWTRPEEIEKCLGIQWKLTQTIARRLEDDKRVAYVFMEGNKVVEFGWNLTDHINVYIDEGGCPLATAANPIVRASIQPITLRGKRRSVIVLSPDR